MSNRFILAKQLCMDDELVWYKRNTDNILFKYIWRRSEINELTFIKIKMDEGLDSLDHPYCIEGRIYKITIRKI
jgi:hypothetical protein